MKCDIIIPIGPGHQNLASRAVGSVNMAEAHSTGPFSDIDVIGIDDTQGLHGRSKARNEGVKGSKADWVFFLDADDLMHPKAFESVVGSIGNPLFDVPQHFDAVWGRIVEYKEGLIYERFQVPRIHHYKHLIDADPYLTLQMGHFVSREVALDYPFREDMNTGEDWEYYLRLWRECSCTKIDAPLFCNVRGEHSTGPRAANGREWRMVVDNMMDKAREDFAGEEKAPSLAVV